MLPETAPALFDEIAACAPEELMAYLHGAMHDGTVTMSGLLGSAKVVRVLAPDGVYESGYAHLASILPSAAKGKAVKRGQQIGTLGRTGAAACHLHLGTKRNRVEVDSWPFLEQVQEEGKHVAAAVRGLQSKIEAARTALG